MRKFDVPLPFFEVFRAVRLSRARVRGLRILVAFAPKAGKFAVAVFELVELKDVFPQCINIVKFRLAVTPVTSVNIVKLPANAGRF